MKRYLSLFLAFIFTLSISIGVYAVPSTPYKSNMRILSPPIWVSNTLTPTETVPIALNSQMLTKNEMGYTEPYGTSQKFTNLLDGYSVVIPADMSVDLSYSDVCTTFTNHEITLRIFKEKFETVSDRSSYLSYSNYFIKNTTDHTLEMQQSYNYNGRTYNVLQWSRRTLSKIENDKNHYACVDVSIGANVYTFFFTGNKDFSSLGGYMHIVESLTTFNPTIAPENAYTEKYKKSDLDHLGETAFKEYNKYFADDANFKLGIFCPPEHGGFEKMEKIEDYIGYDFCMFLQYMGCTDRYGLTDSQYQEELTKYMSFLEKDFLYARDNSMIMEYTLQPPLVRNTSKNMVYEILDGEYDLFFDYFIKLLQSYPDVTIIFRPFNEMNGDWCSYSAYHTSRDPQIYVELYRYMYKRFEDAGCKNVMWVWNPNERSFPNYKWNNKALYYPGDEYVDIFGITGYNTGTYYTSETWRSFDEIYEPIYNEALKLSEKPIMITEFSCSAIGGDKIKWIEEMFRVLPKYDKIKVGVWWHSTDYDGKNLSRPYFIDTPEGTLDVFKKYLGKE